MLFPISTCGWYSSTYSEGPGVSDFQPSLINVCGGKLFVFYHSACEGKGVYFRYFDGFSWSSHFKVSNTHGSESNFACWGDTLILMYYGWGDSVIFRAISYDGGITWNHTVFADHSYYGEDEPFVYKVGDTVYYTYVYEIEGSKLRIKREFGGAFDSLILSFPLPFALHNGQMRALDSFRFIVAVGWEGNGVFLIRLKPSGYDIREVIDTSYYTADIEVFRDTVFILGSGPNFVKFCYSYDFGNSFNCNDVALGVGVVSNVELVITPYGKFSIWADSISRYSIKIFRSLDNINWEYFGEISSGGNEKFPVAIWHNGLNLLWTSSRNGKYEVYFTVIDPLSLRESLGCLEKRFYDVLGRRVDKKRKGVLFEVGCGKVKRIIQR